MNPKHQRKQRKKNASAMRLVGAQVGLFRRAASLTQTQLAEQVCADYETIASIEQGRRLLKPDLAAELDELLETKGALTVALENMPEMDKYPIWAAEFVDRESDAVALCSFQTQAVPGLLQTEAYARAVFRSRVPALSEDEIEHQVAARMERQEILERKVPPSASFILSEAVLMDRLGGPVVFREQLRHLRRCAELPGISLQIMPFGRETHAALDGPFVLLETPDHEHLAYMETQRGSQLISDQDEVSILAQKYAMLRTQALNPEDSRALLDRLLGES
ncbi:helix-turn-helix transcriptional regulator [Streptomyces sp. Z26]|uniref:helix-turn-helix domain-containing protein n=1 Tax=Streptomyces sp. Z26 TaxID=2500177 RepID=UPI001F0BD550|nr:helix-turn-helix transcriptional regulator [Streptomyces sp. Z26]